MDIASFLSGLSTGGALSLLFWIWFLKCYFPRKLKALEDSIDKKIPETVKKIAPVLKKELKMDFGGIIKQLKEKLGDKDDTELKEFIAMLSFYITGAAMDMLENDEHTKAFFRGFINKEAETFFKSVKTRATTEAAKYGVDLESMGNEGTGGEIDPQMAKMMKLFSTFKQIKGIFGGP